MKVDSHLTGDWQKIPDHIKQLESDGYDSAGTAEMNHDPFFPLLLAAEHSQNIRVQSRSILSFTFGCGAQSKYSCSYRHRGCLCQKPDGAS